MSSATRWAAVVPIIASVGTVATAQTAAAQAPSVVVASKPFAEPYLLAEMFGQLLEAQGYRLP